MHSLQSFFISSPLSPLLLPGVTGFLLVMVLTYKIPLRFKSLFLLSLSFPVGLALSSLALFWSYEFLGQYAKQAAIISMAIVCFILGSNLIWQSYQKHRFYRQDSLSIDQPAPSLKASKLGTVLTVIVTIGFILCLFNFFEFILNRLTWNPVGGWDARYVWNLKARFFVRSTEYWRDMFSPLISSWSLRDYPLMLPGSIAWGWNWLGREMLFWPGVVNLAFFLSIALLTIWYTASRSTLWHGLLAGAFFITMPSFQTWVAALYADIPLGFFITASAALLIQAARSRNRNLALLSGLCTGFSMWTKNEGIFFSIWIGFTVILLLFSKHLDRQDKKWFPVFFLCGFAVPAFTAWYLKWNYGGPGIYLQTGRSFGDYLKALTDGARIQYIAANFAAFKASFALWHSLWVFFVSALIFRPMFLSKNRATTYSWVLVLLVLLIDAGYFLIFQITPIDLRSHIQWSLSRLLTHNGVLALLFIFETFSPIDQHPQNSI